MNYYVTYNFQIDLSFTEMHLYYGLCELQKKIISHYYSYVNMKIFA